MPPTPSSAVLVRSWPIVLALALALASGAARADSMAGKVIAVPQDGIFQAAGAGLTEVEARVKEFKDKNKGEVFKLICDFNPDGQPNRSESFGACLDLAQKLQRLQKEHNVRTVAYVHGPVTRHSVLPVLACEEIVLSRVPVGFLGPVGTADRPLGMLEENAYEAIAGTRFPVALVRKFYDPGVEVIQVPAGVGGDRFRDGRKPPRPVGAPVPGLGAGTLASFTHDKAAQYGLAQAEARNSLEEVVRAYGLSRDLLRQSAATPVVCRTLLAGPVNGEMREKIGRRLKAARDQKATLLIVEIACGDGDVAAARDVARQLIEASQGKEPIATVAYVRPPARNLATVLAFACDKIVLHPQATLGDFEGYLQGHPEREEELRQVFPDVVREKRGEDRGEPAVARGMVDRQLTVHWAKRLGGKGEKKFLTEKELNDENQQEARWDIDRTIKPANEQERGRYLTLSAEKAVELGLAESIAESPDQLPGVATGAVRSLDGDLLERIADFLRDPWTSYILIMVALTCLMIELKLPGMGLPGVISAVCFVLYFWSHSQFNGEIVWLALLLFVLGLALVAVEIFILPGFGVCGIGGILCVLAALGLIGVGQIPQTNDDWVNFGNQLGYLLLGMFLAIVAAVLIVRYLPHLPLLNQLLLKPAEGPTEERPGSGTGVGLGDEAEELLGAIGVAATPLRPSGKMQIGDRFLDVVAEGGYIIPGTRVQIVEIEGNRVVVKEI